VQLTLTNTGAAISSWRLVFDLGSGVTLTSGWNATYSQSGSTVTATNAAYNGSLGTGQSAQLGLQVNASGSVNAPSAVSLNGVACSLT
jgi:cellulase/cellobiase CelA1